MSLLEDIFLQDEANEAQELERVIEGDEYDERPRSVPASEDESDNDNSRRDDEAEEDKRRVDPTSTKTKRVVKNPRFILNPARLTGPRGIQVIPEHFKDFKFKGKGYEKDDLDMVLKKLEHWAYRLYPKFQFEDCLKKIETLGKKRPVMVHLHKIRTDQFLSEETVVQKDSSDDEAAPPQEEDEFDKLLQQQIELARATPAPGSVKKGMQKNDQWERVMQTPVRDDRSPITMPKATSSPSISDEQKERMIRNRKLAEERRLARLKQAAMDNSTATTTIIEIDENTTNSNNTSTTDNNIIDIVDENDINNDKNVDKNDENVVVSKKVNRSHVIDSSDSEDDCNVTTVNESIVVDVHNDRKANEENITDEINNVEKNGDDIEGMVVDNDRSLSKEDKDDNNAVVREDNVEKNVVDNDINLVVEDNDDKTDTESNLVVEDNDDKTDTENNYLIPVSESDGNEERKDEQIHDTLENKSTKDTGIIKGIDQKTSEPAIEENISQKNSAEELTEDVMDVDFSDDF